MKYRILFFILFFSIVIETNAETNTQHFLNEYIEACVQKRDATANMKRIQTWFDKLKTKREKNEFFDEIYQTIYNFQRDQNNEYSLPAIEVYLNFAEKDDKNLPLLYFIKGEINAMDLNDTLALKDCISDLMLLDARANSKTNEYISTLQGYLVDARKYIPIYDRIEGWWISANIASYDGLPYFVINRTTDNKISLLGGAGEFVGLQNRVAQNQVDLKRECAYMSWANEKLNTEGVLEVAFKNSVANELGMQAGGLIGSALGSGFLGNVGGSVISAGLSSLFASKPSKDVQIIESQMHMSNPIEVELINHMRAMKMVQGDEPKTIVDTVYNDILVYYYYDNTTPKIFFMDEGKNPFLFYKFAPALFSKENIESEKKMFKKGGSMYDKYEFYKNLVQKNDALFAFNRLQTAKWFSYIEMNMDLNSFEKSGIYHSQKNQNYIGVVFDDKSNDLKVKEVSKSGTAKLYGVKKGDIIIGIDGKPFSNIDTFKEHLQTYERFSKVVLSVKRGNKTLDIPMELGFQINI